MSTYPTDSRLSPTDPVSRSAAGGSSAPWALTRTWLAAIIAVDVLLVLVTVVSELYPETLIVRRFNLSVEHTIGVWWSAMTLALAAVLLATGQADAPGHGRHGDRAEGPSGALTGERSSWLAGLVAAALLFGLSLDELGSLHERAPSEGGLLALLPFALVGAAMLLYTLARWYPRPATRPSAVLLGLGFLCFASVVGQEILEHAVDWPVWAIGLRTGVEEGIELLGIFLCLMAGLRLRGPAFGARPAHTLFRVVEFPHLVAVAGAGLALHVVAAFVSPRLGGYPSQGNPAMWFPMLAYGLAAAALLARSLTRLLDGIRPDAVTLGLLVIFAALSAVHAVFIYPESSLDKLVWRDAAGAGAGLAALWIVRGAPRRVLAISLLPVIALGAYALTGAAEAAFLLAGTSAWASLLATRALVTRPA